MAIYIINMKKDAARMSFMHEQLQRQALSYTRHEAINGRALQSTIIDDYEAIRANKATPWTPPQLGCWLSHRGVWEVIANGCSEYGVVLEDDIHISSDFGLFVSSFEWVPSASDVVRLEAPNNAVLLDKNASHVNGRSVRLVKSTAWCAGGYIITRKAARFLVDQPPSMSGLPDAFLFSREYSPVARSLKIFQVDPALCKQDKYVPSYSRGFGTNIHEPQDDTDLAPKKLFEIISPKRIYRALSGYRRIQFEDR